jgi:ferredoxin-NADP reductase
VNIVTSRVLKHQQFSETGFELILSREGMDYAAGHCIQVMGREETDSRSYTLASSPKEENLRVLYRLIPEGVLTPQLVQLKEGDPVQWSGPFGEFEVRDPSRPLVFFATGSGVAPCAAYVSDNPELNLTLYHGVQKACDLFYRNVFSSYTYYPCVTREEAPGCYHGRVTSASASASFDPESHFYLCGSNEMIMDMYDLILGKGFDESVIFTEAYYRQL